MTKRKSKTKTKKVFRVYCTYTPDGQYYIGFSSKPDAQYEKYFGSNRTILNEVKENPDTHGYTKETIGVFEKQSHAKFVEAMLQIKYRHDEQCLNDMLHLRLRLSYLKDVEVPDWTPKL